MNKYIIITTLIVHVFVSCHAQKNEQTNNNNVENFETFIKRFKTDVEGDCSEHIQFPIPVECFVDRSKGDTLDQKTFSNEYERVFSERIVNEIKNSSDSSYFKVENDYYKLTIGFSYWSETAKMFCEESYHYHFKVFNGEWKLFMISCI